MPWRTQYTAGRLYLYSMPERRKCPDSLTAKSHLCRPRDGTPEPMSCPLSVGNAAAFPSSHCRRKNDSSRYLRGGGILVISVEGKEKERMKNLVLCVLFLFILFILLLRSGLPYIQGIDLYFFLHLFLASLNALRIRMTRT